MQQNNFLSINFYHNCPNYLWVEKQKKGRKNERKKGRKKKKERRGHTRAPPTCGMFWKPGDLSLTEPRFSIYFQLHTASLIGWWGYGSALRHWCCVTTVETSARVKWHRQNKLHFEREGQNELFCCCVEVGTCQNLFWGEAIWLSG